ncbi:hypothetical protein ACFL02_05155 [Planctomycetota bacterium]
MDDCDDKVRFALSDKTGELRFTNFDIVGVPECVNVIEKLRVFLLNQKLADIDITEIIKMPCPGNGQCIQTIVRVIEEYQGRFIHKIR